MISILIISYNTRGYLESGLGKLAHQMRSELDAGEVEVIVVDNASQDGSPHLVAERFPWVRMLPLDENVGFGRANNRGAEIARGEALLLLNSDAWLQDSALAELKNTLETDSKLGLVGPQLLYPDGSFQFSCVPPTGVLGEALQKLRNRFESSRFHQQEMPKLWRPFFGPGWHSGACFLVRSKAFQEIGGFDENLFMYFEDVDFCRRLCQAGWSTSLAPKAEVFHVKGGSQTSEWGEIEYRRSQLYYYRKHRPTWENRFLRWRMRRKFSRISRPGLRKALLSLLEET